MFGWVVLYLTTNCYVLRVNFSKVLMQGLEDTNVPLYTSKQMYVPLCQLRIKYLLMSFYFSVKKEICG